MQDACKAHVFIFFLFPTVVLIDYAPVLLLPANYLFVTTGLCCTSENLPARE